MPTVCYAKATFDFLPEKAVVAQFDGGTLTSDAGLLLLAQLERRVGLIRRMAECLIDKRDPRKVKVALEEMLKQRIFGIAAGYEDCNDHDTLCADPMLKVAAGRCPESDDDLASQPTLSRFENRVTRRELVRMAYALLDDFIDDHVTRPPKRIVLDVDATDDPTHGQQELEGFHGYYETHCYVPAFCFASCDDGPHEPILGVLRPGRIHASRGVPGLVRRYVLRIRGAMPSTTMVFRADAGMAIPEIYSTCESLGMGYAIGLIRNAVLERLAEPFVQQGKQLFEETQRTVQVFGEFDYQAETWPHARRVVVKAEIIASHKDEVNLRFVVTDGMQLSPEDLYEFYVQRGDVESRIDELKNDCFSGRTSCHRFLANQFRLLMHLAAYRLLVLLRRHLRDPQLAVAQVETLRVRVIKVAAKVVESVRRVLFSLAGNYPWIDDWLDAAVVVGGVV